MANKEGDTFYNPKTGQASTLQRNQDGILEWSQPTNIPMTTPDTGRINDNQTLPPPPELSDLIKTAGPAAERAAVGAATTIPTLASGAASLAAKGSDYLPPKLGSVIKSGAEATQGFLKPVTYPSVQGNIEQAYNQRHPNDPLYYPKTGLGQMGEGAIGGGLAAVGGPMAMYRALTGPLAKLGGRIATGVGAGLGSEAAGQVTDAMDLGSDVGGGARIAGALLGGREFAERQRKLVTPNPAISPAHLEMSRLLEKQPGDITTAGQYSGNPKFIQRDANLAPHAPAPYNNLGVTQPKSDTGTLLGTAGISPADAAQGASRPLIKTAKGDIGQRLDDLGANTKMQFDPEFQAQIQKIQDDYHRIKGTSPNPVTPSPVDRRIAELYQDTAKSRRMGLNGGDITHGSTGAIVPGYSTIRSDISKEASGFSGTDKVTAGHLAQIRDALDAAMERSQKGTPYEGRWQQGFDQWESAKGLEKASKQRPPAAGILDPNTVANSTKDPDSKLAELARAQATVHKPLPAPAPPSGTFPAMLGALLSYVTGGSPAEGSIAGHISGPDIQKSLLRNPVTSAIHFSPWNQARLKNQAWQPGLGSTMDPATVARLLALQKTESTPPQEQ